MIEPVDDVNMPNVDPTCNSTDVANIHHVSNCLSDNSDGHNFESAALSVSFDTQSPYFNSGLSDSVCTLWSAWQSPFLTIEQRRKTIELISLLKKCCNHQSLDNTITLVKKGLSRDNANNSFDYEDNDRETVLFVLDDIYTSLLRLDLKSVECDNLPTLSRRAVVDKLMAVIPSGFITTVAFSNNLHAEVITIISSCPAIESMKTNLQNIINELNLKYMCDTRYDESGSLLTGFVVESELANGNA